MPNKYYTLAKKELFLLNRSITGNGIKKTLSVIKKQFPKIKIVRIKSGTNVFDWVIPPEWNIFDAYVLDKNKNKIINFKNNNLHIVSYSHKINKFVNKRMLLKHLHSLPRQKNAIPYVTSYYKKYWGFCVQHKKKVEIKKIYKNNDKFKVVIKSTFKKNGNLAYGELIIPGISKQEILISTYICHPSMANNEMSGPIVSMKLINYFNKIKNLKKTLRFVFIPETIGSIAYLNKNILDLKRRVIGGYNLSCVGDERQHSCMLSKYENTPADDALIEAYKKLNLKYKKYSFLKRGSDERQYNSPGIDLSIASIFRSKYGEYPEYHTSLDNFETVVTEKGIEESYKLAKTSISILLKKIIPKNKILCEPQMSKRNLYPSISSNSRPKITKSIMDFLQYSDGKNDLNRIAKKINIKIKEAKKINKILLKEKLIEI
jgi:aminopeptidase-like protein